MKYQVSIRDGLYIPEYHKSTWPRNYYRPFLVPIAAKLTQSAAIKVFSTLELASKFILGSPDPKAEPGQIEIFELAVTLQPKPRYPDGAFKE